jgi:pyruvate-formate lyase-activating enzyme
LALLLPFLDGALVDFKVFDSKRHCSLTGSDNRKVKGTIRFLAQHGKLHAVRQTVIPGVNADLENALSIARFLAEIDPHIRLRFLRFRTHGTHGEAQGWSSPDDELLESLVTAARAQGLTHVDHSL